jgi:hypothetical protein
MNVRLKSNLRSSWNAIFSCDSMAFLALEACLLQGLLEKRAGDSDPIAGLAPAFFAVVPTLIETPWSVAVLDFAFPDCARATSGGL